MSNWRKSFKSWTRRGDFVEVHPQVFQEVLDEVAKLVEKYEYLISKMAKMDTPSNYYATYALFADSLREDIREDIEATIKEVEK